VGFIGNEVAAQVRLRAGRRLNSPALIALTHHFRILREAGVIHQREAGNRRWTTLRRADLETRFPGVLDAVVDADAATRK